ncbi:MAG: hypothetical protein KF696_08265 [Planctomycetes bacterium]|nr:hypothetical protein [Planctomycetota bacterium]MCW8135655.1 hypothetical protein [Planctomycetota bacterium]
MELMVLHIPGLSARMLLRGGMPAVAALEHSASLVNIDSASPAQQEAALLCGLAPEHLGAFGGGVGEPRAQPFWVRAAAKRAGLRSRVQTALPLPPPWQAVGHDAHFAWHTLGPLPPSPGGEFLRGVDAQAAPLLAGATRVVVLSAWSWAGPRVAPQSCAPEDRPVVLWRGLELAKSTVGILEIAGWLERALTGEEIRDEA